MDDKDGLKRKCTSPDETKNLKRRRNEEPSINFTNLPEYVLLYMFSFLDSTSLYELGRTCVKFSDLVQYEPLWINVDARRKPNSSDKTNYCWDNVHRKTRTILLAGAKRSEVVLSLDKLIYSNALQSLTVLALENQYIKYCRLKDFPNTIQELSFRKSFIAQHNNFFRFSHEAMSNLRTLILDHCQWLLAGCFVSICKYPNLEILSLYMCKKLGDDDMTSIGLAGHYGFPSIKVVDLRFTDIGDAFIRTFYKSATLQVIYLQSFITTYRTERWIRKQDIRNGKKCNEPCYLSDDDDNDMSMDTIQRRYRSGALYKYSSESVTNNTMRLLQVLKPNPNVENPKSSLYVYPYEDCTCSNGIKQSQLYVTNQSHESEDEISESSEDDDSFYTTPSSQEGISFMLPDGAFVCNRIEFDSCLAPAWCQEQSTPDVCRHRWLFTREPRNDHEIDMLEHTDKHFKARMALRTYRDTDRCGEITCGCSRNIQNEQVIVVAQNDRERRLPAIAEVRPHYTKKHLMDETIFDIIGQIAVCMERIKFSIRPDSEILAIVSLILSVLDSNVDCEYANDSTFICHLRVFISEFVRHVKQKIDYILRYHFTCFQSLFHQLQYHERMSARKRLLETFFKNLMHSEITINDDSCNVPGPSSPNNYAPFITTPCKYKNNSNINSETVDGPQEMEHFLDSLTMFVIRRNILDNLENDNERVAMDEVLRVLPPNENAIIVRMVRQQPIYNTYIQELSLRGYRNITNSSLDYLAELNLKLLDVSGTKVTLKGLQRFLLYNPNCRIIHRFACVCRPKLHF